ncbi:hypothetical protein SAMN05444841_102927 [Enterobacter kobei]|nr:hypothetical protein SAMN05444841_102927 [Enterobacter kobei]
MLNMPVLFKMRNFCIKHDGHDVAYLHIFKLNIEILFFNAVIVDPVIFKFCFC